MKAEHGKKPNYQGSLKKSEHRIINKFIKVNKFINRPLAHLIVKAVFRTRITPNQISFFSFFMALAAVYLYTGATHLHFVLGGIFTQLSSIIDCADGQLARARNQCSEYGSHLDLFFDRIGDFLILSAISYGYYLSSKDITLLILGLLSAGLYLLQVNLYYLTNSYKKISKKGDTAEARALLLLTIMILSILNRLDIIILIVLCETVITCLYRLVNFIRLGNKEKT